MSNLHFSDSGFSKNPEYNLAFHLVLHRGGKSTDERMGMPSLLAVIFHTVNQTSVL